MGRSVAVLIALAAFIVRLELALSSEDCETVWIVERWFGGAAEQALATDSVESGGY